MCKKGKYIVAGVFTIPTTESGEKLCPLPPGYEDLLLAEELEDPLKDQYPGGRPIKDDVAPLAVEDGPLEERGSGLQPVGVLPEAVEDGPLEERGSGLQPAAVLQHQPVDEEEEKGRRDMENGLVKLISPKRCTSETTPWWR